ncbi:MULTISPECIES: efflux RND transporter periplasmic adaptor subunit [Sphingomonas]|jgi:Cu(I)/Ag(I) efflux system membrane fusion protein|uniref:Efflux RND transporter periplasmic adaptor subunit n=3 Tax=Pseudomonadota TaxID=1224 RepID=A0ABU4PH51_9SPHN|nr:MULTISPECIES: efflux RND transporter periplasmic adaptor subunit [Sphingomonas]MDR6848948.1 Cu(I)/Ag(I) efflux system membrane fusion protein [Sphingomonas sp. BE137]MDX5983192.1 efflux RND transporter periplasmic adaptor subunit [Sphingomonas echinoides]RUN74948.1 efflux RND transporter periplasmic adaptor subunit [Sphingomonas sp. TF3]
MSQVTITRSRLLGAAALLALAAGGIGFTVAQQWEGSHDPESAKPAARKILYWYDPMIPAEHHDGPGLSSMGMQTIPRYADEAGAGSAAPGISIDPSASQALGLRTVLVRRGALASSVTATGTIDFNQRDIAVVQARTGGFVQRVYARAPGDIIGAGAPLADLLVPEWGGAQAEFLAVRRTGNAALTQAARQRLMLLGMSSGTIASVERAGRPHNVITISTPTRGVIKTLNVRAGMTMMAGQTLAEVNGLGTVWLNAAVPEAIAGPLKPGQTVQATLAAFPGETLSGRVSAILPETQADSRTLTVRIELPNRGGRLRPGMFATVSFGGATQPALLVPSEALIRTGKRTLVMLALDKGRYRPAEVQIGRESGDDTEILAGLSEGEKVVASGQFLIDSEASLSGVEARPIGAATPTAAAKPAATGTLYETVGKIEQITANSVTLSHEPVPAIGWPAMTMTFQLPDPKIPRGLKTGDRVRFGFDRPPAGPTIRRMTKVAGQ